MNINHERSQIDTNEHKKTILYKELSYKIVNAALTVYKALGHGFLEKVYENALALEFKKNNITYRQQAPLMVYYDNILVGEYSADLLVDDKVIIELKAADEIANAHIAQLINYLRATNLRLGMIMNFGKTRFEYKRIIL